MRNTNHPLSEEEFWNVYKRVPRLTVEIILNTKKGVYLTERQIEPCKGLWHFPGGTVRFGEKLTDAVRRIAKRELNIEVTNTKLLGYIEYPSHYLKGLDSPVGIAFQITGYSGEVTINEEASHGQWFIEMPDAMHEEQQEFMKNLP